MPVGQQGQPDVDPLQTILTVTELDPVGTGRIQIVQSVEQIQIIVYMIIKSLVEQ